MVLSTIRRAILDESILTAGLVKGKGCGWEVIFIYRAADGI